MGPPLVRGDGGAGAGPGGGTAVYREGTPVPRERTAVYREGTAAPRERTAVHRHATEVYREIAGTGGAPGASGTAVYREGVAPGAQAPADGAVPRPGDRVRQYELIRRLGQGGMGEVFLARDTRLGRRVAIKFLHTEDPGLVDRFVLEARATARCSHENIVTLFEADTFNGRPYMALEYLQGETLAALLDGGQPMPPGRAVELVLPVLRALSRAHAEGIVHRDLKPDNVVLTEAGVVKVLDFGIAKVLGGEQRALDQVRGPAPDAQADRRASPGAPLTQHGTTVGTLQYMSPEQWTGDDIDHRTDLWAVGVILFRMLAGRHPLHGRDGMELSCVADRSEPMPSLRALAPGVPPGLAEAVDGCLRKDRDQRPADALALLRLLEPFMPGRLERAQHLEGSPFAGLSAFQEADAGRFFGRDREIAALVNRLRDRPALAVVGASGVGKSSFIRAGVVPALKRLGEPWDALVLRPGRSPLAALAGVLAQAGAITSPGTAPDELQHGEDLTARLAEEPGHAGAALRAHARRQGRRILLFVDQLEEIYTLVPDAPARLAFTACLAGIADDVTSPVRLVLSIRSDFLGRLSEDPRLMAELGSGLFFLTTPSDDGLRDALTVPVEMAGYRFESPALVDELVRDLRSTQGALPLLQFAATQLWEARDPARRVLTRGSYEAIGGIAGALARYADRVLEELPPKARGAVREVFLRLVTPERTRAIVSVEELLEVGGGAEVERLVEQLAQSRLLVIERSDRGSTAEIVHESLIHGWPTLRRWLDESGEDAELLERIRTGARQWDANGRHADLLWRGEPAQEAGRFQRRYRGNLAEAQRAFLEAILANATRVARRRRALVVGAVSALLLVVAGSLVAVVVIRRAQTEAVRQAQLARTAEVEARQRAEALAVKERERAEAARLAAEEARRAEAAGAELAVKNAELVTALENAEAASARATEARRRAEQSSAMARRARQQADTAARELALRLEEEQERVRRLKEQFGSPIADALPR